MNSFDDTDISSANPPRWPGFSHGGVLSDDLRHGGTQHAPPAQSGSGERRGGPRPRPRLGVYSNHQELYGFVWK